MQENESKPTATKPTKRGRKPRGLGDTIEQITTATGIKAAVDWFSEATGVDCGCDARKEKLNKLFRYRKPECLTRGVRVHWHDERPQRGKRSATNGTE
jgi:hypothetical protein